MAVTVLVRGGGRARGFASARGGFMTPLLGRPVVSYTLRAVSRLKPGRILLAAAAARGPSSHSLEGLEAWLPKKMPLSILPSGGGKKASGTGLLSALLDAKPLLRGLASGEILAVPADRPLLTARTLRLFLAAHRRNGCSLSILSCGPDLERDSVALIRARDLAPVLAGRAGKGERAGLRLLAALLAARGGKVGLTEISDREEGLRVSGLSDLAPAAAALRRRQAEALSRRGVALLDPATTWLDADVRIGAGTIIYPSVVIEGASRVGRDCRIYPHVHIMSSRTGDRVRILGSTVVDESRIEDDAQVGPFTRLRPGTIVRTGSRVGNFVEMKNTVFGPRSKAQHLSYLGDSLVEEDVNIGAGTITCNYDGIRKNRTHIGAGAFIGSGSELVAPVRIGKRAYVAAGSTVTRDVADGSLAIGRARQVEKPGWVLERLKKLGRKPRPRK
jgi:bifunctional UDP-N-acetylglucosamine pyrophosphorylase/glucosamine-1-phosphate N-acetyltransferase